MARTVSDVRMPTSNWPPEGWYLATCLVAEAWKSPNKKTPAVMLTWGSPDGVYQWDDPLFVTGKAIGRLSLVATRVSGISPDTALPDDDEEAARFLARYVCDHTQGKQALVEIVATEETFIYEEGPKTGQKGTRIRHRVAFGGYDAPNANRPLAAPTRAGADGDNAQERHTGSRAAPPPDDDCPPPNDGSDDIPF